MELIVPALILGAVIGYFRLLPPCVLRFTNQAMTVGIVLLLFLMGGQIGSDQAILAGLGQMGFQAFLYALAAIGGSVLAVKALEAVVPFGEKEAFQEGGEGE